MCRTEVPNPGPGPANRVTVAVIMYKEWLAAILTLQLTIKNK